MFIWTISDIVAIILFIAIIAYLIYFFASGHQATKEMNKANSIEAKKKPEPKESKKEAPFWMSALAFIIIIAAIYAYCAWRGLLH